MSFSTFHQIWDDDGGGGRWNAQFSSHDDESKWDDDFLELFHLLVIVFVNFQLKLAGLGLFIIVLLNVLCCNRLLILKMAPVSVLKDVNKGIFDLNLLYVVTIPARDNWHTRCQRIAHPRTTQWPNPNGPGRNLFLSTFYDAILHYLFIVDVVVVVVLVEGYFSEHWIGQLSIATRWSAAIMRTNTNTNRNRVAHQFQFEK